MHRSTRAHYEAIDNLVVCHISSLILSVSSSLDRQMAYFVPYSAVLILDGDLKRLVENVRATRGKLETIAPVGMYLLME